MTEFTISPKIWISLVMSVVAQVVVWNDASSVLATSTVHDTPDGFIERSIAIVVRERTVEISIQIGINAKTMRDQMVGWNPDEPVDAFETETELTQRYCDMIPDNLLNDFGLTMDDQELEMKLVSVDPFAEHHKTAVVKLTAQIPEELDSVELVMRDHSFLEFDGAVRYAIKGRGKTLLTKSNVAPIIIRAKRVELGDLDTQQRKDAGQIRAKIKILAP